MEDHERLQRGPGEKGEAPADVPHDAVAASPMPLSMPPFTAAPQAEPGEPPLGRGGREPGMGGEPVPGPMPLSMPPFGVQGRDEEAGRPAPGGPASGGGVAAGGTVPPWYYGPPGGWQGAGEPPSTAGQGGRRGRRRRQLVAAAAAVLLAGGLGAGLGAGLSGGSPSSSASGGPASGRLPVISGPSAARTASSGPTLSTAAIVKAVSPGVVDINTDVASESSVGQTQAAGTGMIITSGGQVLTNNHVVEDATKITVSIQGEPGTYAAKVVGVDPTKDVALLQILGFSGRLPTVRLGNSSTVQVGDSVVAIGNALGLGHQPTAVTGEVTALDRTITAGDQAATTLSETLKGVIETNADIIPGDSGGPLVNSQGVVIGMDTAAATSGTGQTLGFSIPINEARAIVQQMEQGKAGGGVILGLSPFLGIFYDGTSGSGFGGFFGFGFGSSAVPGVPVADVSIGGPAQAAGIAGGDTITKIDSVATPSFPVLQKVIASKKPGERVTVTWVDTSGATHTAVVTLAGIPQ